MLPSVALATASLSNAPIHWVKCGSVDLTDLCTSHPHNYYCHGRSNQESLANVDYDRQCFYECIPQLWNLNGELLLAEALVFSES